jgi:DNA ligase D-like protein (predicted ligase)
VIKMIEPMLAEKAKEPFDSPTHLYEVKYDGARCIAYVGNGQVRLLARSGTDYTTTFPELREIHRQLNATEVVLDGELVVEEDGGIYNFQALQSRVHRMNPLAVRVAAQSFPATYLVFDVLRVNGVELTANGQRVPLEARKALLARLLDPSQRCRMVEHVEGEGIAFFQECIRRGLEGVMAKDRQGLYYPGKRHPAWLKVKGVQEDSFLVCGYTEGEGWREGLFGALLLGRPDGQGGLRYCGSVGTGFTVAGLAEVQELVKDLHTQECPFPRAPYEPKLFSYLEPRVVVEVKYHEQTADGKLRFPVFLRVRRDLGPENLQ